MSRSVIIKTYDNRVAGTISQHGDVLHGSDDTMQSIADTAVRRAGSANGALTQLDGWQNGYLFACSDSETEAK